MWSSPFFWMFVAVAVFWALGAYNRLMRLRSAAIQAFGGLDVHLVRWIALLGEWEACHALPPSGIVSDQAEQAQAHALVGATNQLGACLAVARARPLRPEALAALSSACAVVRTCWQAASQHASRQGFEAERIAWQARWDDTYEHSQRAAEVFRDAVDQYNAGVAQFPARLLAWAFGFKSAQALALQEKEGS